MDTILQGILNVVCYIDDILITGPDEETHLNNLAEVLKWLRLRVNLRKSAFFCDSMTYLGHIIDANGLHATSEMVEAIQLAP